MVFPKDYGVGGQSAGKRSAPASGGTGAAKKVKTDGSPVDVDIHETAKRGNLNKLTVAVLKSFCQEQKLKSKSQRKADLISAINEHFSIE